MRPWRCSSVVDGRRCSRLRLHLGYHVARWGRGSEMSWGRSADKRQTYETDAPWVTWTWLSTDRETRITGRMRMRMECCICGAVEIVRPRIPRWGPVPIPEGGRHAVRVAAVERHHHTDRRNPILWRKPLRNLSALGNTSIESVIRTRLDP